MIAGTRGGGGAGPDFDPDMIVYKELRLLGALGVDNIAYARALELLAERRYPFEALARRIVGFDGVADLLGLMAGEGDVPPVHVVVVPGARGLE